MLTDKGTEVVVYKATSADVYLRVQEPVRDINGNVTYDANGNVVLQTVSDQIYPGNFECAYNCTGNALTEQNFTISSDQITPQYRQEEGWKDIPLNQAKKGDVGLYIDNNTGTVTHLEPFLTNTTVSTKGGIAADPGPVQPGQSAQFLQAATYQLVTKTQ